MNIQNMLRQCHGTSSLACTPIDILDSKSSLLKYGFIRSCRLEGYAVVHTKLEGRLRMLPSDTCLS